MSELESLPGCLGYYEAPLPSVNCDNCDVKEICKKVTHQFVPRKTVEVFLNKIVSILKE